MKKLTYPFGNKRLALAKQDLQRLVARRDRTDGAELLDSAMAHVANNEPETAQQTLDRFELVASQLDATDRALLQGIRRELKQSQRVRALLARFAAQVAAKVGSLAVWAWIKTLLHNYFMWWSRTPRHPSLTSHRCWRQMNTT